MGVLSDASRAVARIPPLRGITFIPADSAYRLTALGRGLPGERNYASLVGDGTNNSIVESLIGYVCREFMKAPIALRKFDGEDDETGRVLRRHPFLQLQRRPNRDPKRKPHGWYGGKTLTVGKVTSLIGDGNAYVWKVRERFTKETVDGVEVMRGVGPVRQLWYWPHFLVEPRWPVGGNVFISHYEYLAGGDAGSINIHPDDVIHYRDGVDPENPRKGMSRLKKLLREVASDELAARFTASLLVNFGVPGLVLAPKEAGWLAQDEDVKAIKERLKEEFTGDHRGEPIVMSGPTTVESFGFSPKDLDLSAIRDVPEERLSAAVGIPAAVVGLGTGLQQVKVGATMTALEDQAWQNGIIPRQEIFAEEDEVQLLPEFVGEDELADHEVFYDLTNVPIMADYWDKVATRWERLFRAGIAKRREARRPFGLRSDDGDDVYSVNAGASVVGSGDPAPTPAKPPAAPGPGDDEEDDEEAEDGAA